MPYTPGTDGAGTIARARHGRERLEGRRPGLPCRLRHRHLRRAGFSASPRTFIPCPTRELRARPRLSASPTSPPTSLCSIVASFAPARFCSFTALTGGVGLAALQLARAVDVRVLATGGTPAGRALLSDEGAYAVFDHHAGDYPQEVLAATDGRGVDMILEMLANVNLGKDLPMLAQHGRVVIVGRPRARWKSPHAISWPAMPTSVA
ncbi:MAG: zinc-binding dehydrogenase [Chthoniobacter sp.]